MRNQCKRPNCPHCWFEHEVAIPVIRDALVFGSPLLIWKVLT